VTGAEQALRLAHDLADIADAITLPAFRASLRGEGATTTKADGSVLTAADLDAERAVRRQLRLRRPGDAVLGEEDGLDGRADAPTWIIDPIDGTDNFVRGIPVFATLIAYVVEGEGVAAVISAPALGSRWDGVAGGPAHQDGEEIHVSTVDDLAGASVSFGGLRYFAAGTGLGPVTRLGTQTARQRGFGDFWQHCLVAAGGLDVALEAEVSRWDLAAPKVIVEAAGGRFTSFAGDDTDAGGTAVSSNSILHDAVLAQIEAPD
jgi:histidinol-phosphatase